MAADSLFLPPAAQQTDTAVSQKPGHGVCYRL